ncbi:hypothetical protein Bca4012_026802 [Brassica carinata]
MKTKSSKKDKVSKSVGKSAEKDVEPAAGQSPPRPFDKILNIAKDHMWKPDSPLENESEPTNEATCPIVDKIIPAALERAFVNGSGPSSSKKSLR